MSVTTASDPEAQALAEPEFGVEWTEAALQYLPLFEHLPLPQPQKLQLIMDLLTVIAHVFDACLTAAAGTAVSGDPVSPSVHRHV